jgi:hypothetical protein
MTAFSNAIFIFAHYHNKVCAFLVVGSLLTDCYLGQRRQFDIVTAISSAIRVPEHIPVSQ